MKVNKTIINAILEGKSDAALKELYRKTLPKVKNYVLKNRGNYEDVKDVFQEAVAILFQKIKVERFEPKGDIHGYLYMMCKNLWINKAKREQKMVSTPEYIDIEDSAQDYHSFLASKERKSLVKGLMADIGEPCATFMTYLYFQEYSLKKIVELMGLSSVGVAKVNSHRCKKKMQKLIEGNATYKRLVKELLE